MQVNSESFINTQSNSASRIVQQELGKDEFLKLLVAQLKHQNPLEPLDDTQFIAQMAQFSSLEQLQNINETMYNFGEILVELLLNQRELATSAIFSDAVTMIGREVSAFDPETSQAVHGLVSKAKLFKGIPYLEISGVEIPAAYVTWVGASNSNTLDDNKAMEEEISDGSED